MSVNAMTIEDVGTFLDSIHAQVTNTAPAGFVAPGDFVSVANSVLQMGTDVVYNAVMNTITKTIFSTRPYSRQFGGLIVDNAKWGGITRKIQFGDTNTFADKAFHNIVDGQSVDHYIVNKGDVLETRYYGSDVYQDVMTVFRDQLINAFSGPEQLGSFISAKANEVNNKWVQWTEDLVRAQMINTIAAKVYYYDVVENNRMHVSHLLTEYNTTVNGTYKYEDIMGAQAKPFWEWVRAKIRSMQRDFTTRTSLHYMNVSGHKIIRHTPYVNQKVYLTAPYMDLMETSTLSEAFHNDMLKYADYEGVAYWQNVVEYDSIYVNNYAYAETSNNVAVDWKMGTVEGNPPKALWPLLGVIFDEDMMMVNIKDTIIQNTPMNGRGLYYNTWLTAHAQYCTDFTEKCCVLLLD